MAAGLPDPPPSLDQKNTGFDPRQGQTQGLVPMKLTVWNEANCNRLRQWWEVDGLIARQVADKFREIGCDVTRNAVIGKVHRMKLMQPASKVEALRNVHSETLKLNRRQQNGSAVPRL